VIGACQSASGRRCFIIGQPGGGLSAGDCRMPLIVGRVAFCNGAA